MDRVSYMTHYRLEGVHWWSRARTRIVAGLLSGWAPVSSDPYVVDIGCGAGSVLSALRGMGYRGVGIENSEEAVEEAARMGNTFVRQGEAPEAFLPLPEGPHVFLLLDVLEHVSDDRALLSRIVERMPAGSKVLITVPALSMLWSEHDEMYGHFRRYDRAGLAGVVTGAGLAPVFTSYFCTLLFPFILAARLAKRLLPFQTRPDLRLVNRHLNRVLESVFSCELQLLRLMPLPVGSSLIVLAEKP